MWIQLVLVTTVISEFCRSEDVFEKSSQEIHAKEEKKMSDQILFLLKHFQQQDPVGLPGAEIADPYPVPDVKQFLTLGIMYFKDTAVHGTSQFRVTYLDADFEAMEIKGIMIIDKLQARGNYTYAPYMWMSRDGAFSVDVTGLQVTGRANLTVERDGRLRTKNIQMDLEFETLKVNFENLDFLGSMLQGFINTIGSFLFDSMKPYILQDAYKAAREAMDKNLEEFCGDTTFPNSIMPLDMIAVDAGKKMQDIGMDPYNIDDYNNFNGIVSIALTNTLLKGLSSFHRIGNITLTMENRTIVVGFDVGSTKLEGSTNWNIATFGNVLNVFGTASFSVEYIKNKVIFSQPLDTRKKAVLKHFDIELGNIQIRFDGAGILDYMIEIAVNIFPNILREQIVNGLKSFMKAKIQEELIERTRLEEVIMQVLPRLDQMDSIEIKLSALQVEKRKCDGDEFFNF